MFDGFIGTSLAAKAIEAGHVSIRCIDFREYTADRHRRVDDYPFGGAPGMLLSAQPLFDCFDAVLAQYTGHRCRNIYMSPQGERLCETTARRLAADYDVLNILCGHYEGVDQRVLDTYIEEEISIGDYVLTGGELPAMVLMDCIMRFVPGVLGNADSAESESFSGGLLEYPQYTRPSSFRGLDVPEILLSGHHANIARWQRAQAIENTWRRRPDLLAGAELTEADRALVKELETAKNAQGTRQNAPDTGEV